VLAVLAQQILERMNEDHKEQVLFSPPSLQQVVAAVFQVQQVLLVETEEVEVLEVVVKAYLERVEPELQIKALLVATVAAVLRLR
jgi:hypothetical protein